MPVQHPVAVVSAPKVTVHGPDLAGKLIECQTCFRTFHTQAQFGQHSRICRGGRAVSRRFIDIKSQPYQYCFLEKQQKDKLEIKSRFVMKVVNASMEWRDIAKQNGLHDSGIALLLKEKELQNVHVAIRHRKDSGMIVANFVIRGVAQTANCIHDAKMTIERAVDEVKKQLPKHVSMNMHLCRVDACKELVIRDTEGYCSRHRAQKYHKMSTKKRLLNAVQSAKSTNHHDDSEKTRKVAMDVRISNAVHTVKTQPASDAMSNVFGEQLTPNSLPSSHSSSSSLLQRQQEPLLPLSLPLPHHASWPVADEERWQPIVAQPQVADSTQWKQQRQHDMIQQQQLQLEEQRRLQHHFQHQLQQQMMQNQQLIEQQERLRLELQKQRTSYLNARNYAINNGEPTHNHNHHHTHHNHHHHINFDSNHQQQHHQHQHHHHQHNNQQHVLTAHASVPQPPMAMLPKLDHDRLDMMAIEQLSNFIQSPSPHVPLLPHVGRPGNDSRNHNLSMPNHRETAVAPDHHHGNINNDEPPLKRMKMCYDHNWHVDRDDLQLPTMQRLSPSPPPPFFFPTAPNLFLSDEDPNLNEIPDFHAVDLHQDSQCL